MLPLEQPDRIQIAFDDHRLVANAGLLLPVTLAQRPGLSQLVDRHVDLGRAPGRANPGDKVMTLVASALAGGDCIDDADACIDDADALRTGSSAQVLGGVVKAPSTLGTFLPGDLPCILEEPGAAGPGLAGWRGTRHHSPSTWTPPSARPTDWPRRVPATTATPASEAITRCWPGPGLWGRHRRRADVPAARGPRQHRSGRRPLPA